VLHRCVPNAVKLLSRGVGTAFAMSGAMPSQTYQHRVAQLSRMSVSKHVDAYADIDWDNPAFRIEREDPRWALSPDDTLGATDWYRSQPSATQARLGLHLTINQLKLGVAFESVLCRGLLEFASTLPNGSPEFRYAYHEVIEEGQHSLMFQEFINRSGLDARGLTGLDLWSSRRVPTFGRKFPELFFLFVLGGETPIDCVQREALASGREMHPLLERIMRIHVTEEARHISFAHSFVRERVPLLGAFRMATLRVRAPILFKAMAAQMMRPPRDLIDAYRIPHEVVREAYLHNPTHRRLLVERLAPVRRLCTDVDIATPRFIRFWKWLGIWPDEMPLQPQPQGDHNVRSL